MSVAKLELKGLTESAMPGFDRVFLWANALVYVAFGLWGLIAPGQMMARFGVVLTDGAGKTAIRATYGGFLTGTGALIGSCALASERLVLQVVLILSSSILTARVIGMIADRSANAYHLTYACLEITAILVSGAGLISGAVTSAPG